MSQALEFVFSFRSPYSWFATTQIMAKLPEDVAVNWRPFFPLPEFANFAGSVQGRWDYNIRDVMRLAKFFGLPLKWHAPEDPDWSIPHAAFVRANELGAGMDFVLAIYEARYLRGEDVSLPRVIEVAAEAAGVDAADVVAASQDTAVQGKLTAQIRADFDDRGIFGVPTLILPRGSRFWGHDRIDWALREGFLDEALAAARPAA